MMAAVLHCALKADDQVELPQLGCWHQQGRRHASNASLRLHDKVPRGTATPLALMSVLPARL